MIRPDQLSNIDNILGNQSDISKLIADVQVNEPLFWAWANNSFDSVIESMPEKFEDIFALFPLMPIHIKNFLIICFFRGYLSGEAKWKPDLDNDTPKYFYKVIEDDFK